MNIEIKNRWDNKVIVCGEYESIKDCLEKNRDAYLGGADLGGAKNYLSNHDFWLEIIRRQTVETFTEKEWAMVGVIFTHRLCWDSIVKRYGKKIMPLFKKLTKAGFNEWEEYYKTLIPTKEEKE